MDEWMSSAGSVREQSDGLRSSASSAKEILGAMLRCNSALETKLKSPRWRSELQQGEAVASRLDRSALAAVAAAERLAPLLNAFEAARGEAEIWERRQKQACEVADRFARLMNGAQSTIVQLKQAQEAAEHLTRLIAQAQNLGKHLTDVDEKQNGLARLIAQARAAGTNLTHATDKADRLSRLVSQAHAIGNHLEKSIDSRQRLIAAMAQNTSQLVDVLQTARLADESDHPTPAGTSRRPETPASPVGKPPSRINRPMLHAPFATK
jgi:hypothetical protein